jgi:cytochrome c553
MRKISVLLSACAATVLPLAVIAMANARHEYLSVIASKPNLERGAEIFQKCVPCHGSAGTGTVDGNVPRIAGQHFRVIARQLVDYRHNMRLDIRMEHYTNRHIIADAQAIADVAAYVSQMAPQQPADVGGGNLLESVEGPYAARCGACHGGAGEGNDVNVVPRIAGQHREYLLRQMYNAIDGRRPNFSPAHIHIFAQLDPDQLKALADILSRSEWTLAAPQDAK